MDITHIILILIIIGLLVSLSYMRDQLVSWRQKAAAYYTETALAPKFHIGQRVAFFYAGEDRVGVVQSIDVSKTYRCSVQSPGMNHNIAMNEQFIRDAT